MGVKWNILRTMVDGKIRGILSGRKGAHCFNCNWDLEDYYPQQGAGELFKVLFLIFYSVCDCMPNIMLLFLPILV